MSKIIISLIAIVAFVQTIAPAAANALVTIQQIGGAL